MRGVQLKLCATLRPLIKGHFCRSLHVSIYSTQQRIENDVSARLPNITLASCDLDF